MKLPVLKTLYEAFLPTIWVNLAFGLGVLQYPFGKQRRIISAVWSVINLLIYLSFVKIASLSHLSEIINSKIAADSFTIHVYSSIVFMIIMMGLAQANSKSIANAFNKLKVINDRLRTLGISEDLEFIFKIQVVHFSIGLAFIPIVVVMDFLYVGTGYPFQSYRNGFLLAVHHWLIFAFVADSSYTLIFRYYCNRFQNLNSLLVKPELWKKTEVEFIQNSKEQFLRSPMLKEIHENLRIKRPVNENQLLYTIQEIRDIHRALGNTALDLNKAFSIQMILSITLSFGMITALSYTFYVFSMASATLEREIADVMLRILPLIWITFYVIKIFLIINSSTKTSSEAKRTGELIYTLLDTTLIRNKDICNEINMFSLQLIQNPLRLTAYGFFTMDYELIRAMILTVTTFLVIMIQMQRIYEPIHAELTTPTVPMIKGQDL